LSFSSKLCFKGLSFNSKVCFKIMF
jgi:hypothetical protein